MSSHTHGPWRDVITNEGELTVELGEHMTLYMGDMETTEAEDHANARLIAAAPDLYDAICQYFGSLQTNDWQEAMASFKSMQAALAKAEGRDE